MKKTTHLLLSLLLVAFTFGYVNAQDINNPNGYVQVYEIASESNLKANKWQQYTYENDTLIIDFLFWSSQGKMKVRIENKLNVPIYINWSKSIYFIDGGELPMTPYVDKLDNKQFALYEKYKASEPTLTDMDYEWKKQMSTEEQEKKDQIVKINAKSVYTKGNYYIIPKGGFELDTASPMEVVKHSSVKNKKAFVYKASYSKEASPVKFGVSIIYSTEQSVTKGTTLKEMFYVTDILEMDAKHFRGKKVGKTPEGFNVYKFPERRSNRCYVEIDRRISIEFNKGVR